MSLMIITENMDNEEIPTGETLARLYQIYDIGYQSAGEGYPPRREFVYLFELDAVKKDGNPHLISQRFTASMHPKSNLRAFLEEWRGTPYPDDDVKKYNAEAAIGQYGFLTVVTRAPEKGKKGWAEIFHIRPRGKTAPFMTRMKPGFVPEWVKKAIAKQLPPPTDAGGSAQNSGYHDQGGSYSGNGQNGGTTPAGIPDDIPVF